ncbi:hypothetical protein ACFL6G_01635 [candidate division KSB1 bacterium]
MFGTEYSFNHFKPSSFNESPGEDTPEGKIDVQSLSAYALYGLNNKANIILVVPFERWRQSVNVSNVHMRNETISGIGDIMIGVRVLVKNQTTTTGHRFFAGVNFSIPTGDSFNIKLYSDAAFSAPHNHFAIGKGNYTSTLNFEYWHRPGIPVLAGVSGAYNFALNESSVGFRSGDKIFFDLQATILKTVFWNSYPYFKLRYQYNSPDQWDNADSRNTGGKYINGTTAFIVNVNESFSVISFADFPLWRSLKGAQLDNFIFSVSFRKMLR